MSEWHQFAFSHYSYTNIFIRMLIAIAEAYIGMKRGKMNVPTHLSLHELHETRNVWSASVELAVEVLQPRLSFSVLIILPFLGTQCHCCLTQTFWTQLTRPGRQSYLAQIQHV